MATAICYDRFEMRPLIVIRRTPKIDFMAWHKVGFALSLLLTLSSIVLFLTVGLNYGIDFVGGELIRAGVIATILALIAIAAYIWFRFEWQFGVGGMISTLHDVVTTVGLFALFQLEFNLTTLAAILTVAGYSVNDTVVIYDRIRESLRKYPRMPFRDLINLALNETLSRTILTVSTVAIAVLSLLFLGGEVLRGFSIAMLWGVVIGT